MKTLIQLLVALCLVVVPAVCDACACCNDPGGWGQWSETMVQFLASQEHGTALRAATIFGRVDMGDTVDGLAQRDSVVLAFRDDSIELRNVESGNVAARIILDGEVERFGVDTGESDLYYVEWRFHGAVETGDSLRSYWLGRRATIVIQGRQTACFEPGLMKHWVARFDGPGYPQSDVRGYGTVVMGPRD